MLFGGWLTRYAQLPAPELIQGRGAIIPQLFPRPSDVLAVSFPANIIGLASHPSHQLVVTTWIDFARQTIAISTSPAIPDSVDLITRSIGIRLNGDFERRHLGPIGRLLLSPRPDHVLFGYQGLFYDLSRAPDTSLVEGIAQVVRTGLSVDRAQEASIRSAAAVAISGVLTTADRIEPVIWDFVKVGGRAIGWLKMRNIIEDRETTRGALSDVVERHVDSVPLEQLTRMVNFLEEDDAIHQGGLAFHPGYVNELSPLRLRLVRRLLREFDSWAPDYTRPNDDPFLRVYYSLLPWNLRSAKLNRNKITRILRKMESDLDPTRRPGPRGWRKFLPESLRNIF